MREPRETEHPRQSLPIAGGVVDILSNMYLPPSWQMWEAIEAQGVHIVGCIRDDDAATLLSGLAWAVAVWIPEPWCRNPGGAEGGGELLASFCCTALMALGGLVLLFWKLTFSLPLPRSRAAGSAFSSADFGEDAQGRLSSYRLVQSAICMCACLCTRAVDDYLVCALSSTRGDDATTTAPQAAAPTAPQHHPRQADANA